MKQLIEVKISSLCQALASIFAQPSERQVYPFCNLPNTVHQDTAHRIVDKSISADSEKVIRLWLEQSYYF